MGIDDRTFPVGTKPCDTVTKQGQTPSMFAGDWFPIQVKQTDKVGRPTSTSSKPSWPATSASPASSSRLAIRPTPKASAPLSTKKTGRIIKLINVQEILDEQHVQKM